MYSFVKLQEDTLSYTDRSGDVHENSYIFISSPLLSQAVICSKSIHPCTCSTGRKKWKKVPFCKRLSSAFNYVKVCYPVCLSDDNKKHLSPYSSLTLLAMSWPLCWHRLRRDMKELPAEITAKNSTYPSTDGWLRHSLAHFVVSSNRMIHDICCCFLLFFECFSVTACRECLQAGADMDISVRDD